MARRTVIEDSPTVVEDSSGPALGLVLGLLLGIAVVVLAVLFFAGTWDDNNTSNTPSVPGTDSGSSSQPQESAPSQDQQPSTAPS
ncbi:MAG: hypothetical protein M3P04_05700 [Actinomycetota bacterium]|nr:hypothetical protein [Actinomycetota bacterium]